MGDCDILGCAEPRLLPPSTCLRKAVEVVSLLAGKRCSVVLQGGGTGMGDGEGWRGLERGPPSPPCPTRNQNLKGKEDL